MTKIISALVVTAALGMLFAPTRRIGLLCVALLAYLYPIPVITLILIGGVSIYYYKQKMI